MLKRYYRLANLIILILAMLLASTLFIFTINQVSKIYAENTSISVYELKKSYLYDHINNFILNIETQFDLVIENQNNEIGHTILFLNR